jgi:iron complex outermembrane recepter protein
MIGILEIHRQRTLLAGVSGFAILMAAGGAYGQQLAEAGSPQVSEVVVTAQKREERLTDVPISISVLGGESLDRSVDRGVTEAINRVPGVFAVANPTNNRVGGNASVTIRGVAPSAGSAGTTAFYVDSVPFGFINIPLAPDMTAYDLDRVEVLRGPQGTLYGANALNGVVRVLTRDANLRNPEFKARASLSNTEHGAESYRGDLAASLPLIEDKLGARVVLGYQKLGGWIDKPIDKDVNSAEIRNVRLKINAEPTERLSVELSAWFSRADINGPPGSPNNRTNVSVLDEPAENNFDLYGGTINYDFGSFQFTSMTSWIDFENTSRFDYTPFIAAERTLFTGQYSRVFSQEVGLNSNLEGPWRWTVGGIYRRAKETNFLLRTQYFAPNHSHAKSESVAVFGELTREFLDGQVELTGGLRYFEDHVSNIELSEPFSPGGIPAGGLRSARSKFDKVTPRVVLTWHLNDDLNVYGSFSQGFRSGFNQSFSVAAVGFASPGPDTLTSYEIGAKGSAWGGRVNFDGAVFYIDWKDVQQQLNVIVRQTPLLLTGASVNSEAASGFGAEFSAAVKPTEGLTLGASVSWNDLTLDAPLLAATSATTTRIVLPKGSRLLNSPELTVAANADYVFDLGASGFKGRVSAGFNYRPRVIYASPVTAGSPQTYGNPSFLARASFAVEAPENWTLGLFVDNITNNKATYVDQFNPRWNVGQRPRTVGVQLEYQF